jgi:hypothetical protein
MKKLIKNIEHLNSITLWMIIFFYSLLMSLLIQLFLLPVFFPNWCDPNGLLNGGDSQYFHQIAVTVSEQIKMQDWGAWTLRPQGQSPSGVAAILYTLFTPKPWVLLPLNAILHATASLVLLKILNIVFKNHKTAIIGTLPFIFFPTTFLWLAQIHKDGFTILGNLLVLLGLLLFLDCRWKPPFSEEWKALLFFWLGVIAMWIPRPYQLKMLQGELVIIAVLILILALFRQKKLFWPDTITPLVLVVLMVAINPLALNLGIDEPMPQAGAPQAGAPQAGAPQLQYQRTSWMPPVLENLFAGLSRLRDRYIQGYPNAASQIDTNDRFANASQIFAYLPRAVEISLLSPFPSEWFRQGSLASTTMMRRVAAVEMTITYFSLICLLLLFLKTIKRTEIWVIVAYCLGMMVVNTLSTPNVGTLYRFRYGFIMVLVGLGIGYFYNFYWLARRKTH